MFAEIFCFVVGLIFMRIVWMRWKYDLHKIPSPPGLPILGHTLEFVKEGSKNFSKWFRKNHRALGCPKIMKVQVGFFRWTFVMDPFCIKSVINSKTDPLPREATLKLITEPIICHSNTKESLITSCHRSYVKEIRKAYTNGLQQSQIRKCFPKMKSVLNRMIQILESKRQGGPIDIQQLCVEFALDSMGVVAFETNLGGLDGSRNIIKGMSESGHVGREQLTNPFMRIYCLLFPLSQSAKNKVKCINNIKQEWIRIAEDILERPDPSEGETPLWYNLKAAIDPETNEKLTFEMLRMEIATIVFGGMDSTGHQLAWILGMIATHPNISEKLVEELQEHELCGPNRREIEFSDLSDLPYLDAVIKEGFRITYVMTSSAFRKIPKDMTLLGYRLPKGTVVVFPGNRAMNTESDWGDPDVVRPERWMTGEDMSSKYFWTFQTGPRDCPGQKLAMFEIRLAIVELISKYHLSSNQSFEQLLDKSKDSSMIECEGGLWLQVSPR